MGGIALISFTTSCSKDQSMADAPKIKKDSDSIVLLIENFIDDYNDHMENESGSTTPSIEYDHAIWLLEATLNYQNAIDPEGSTVYVNPSSPFSSTALIDWTVGGGGGTALVSEADLFELYDDIFESYSGKAPITDIELLENSSS